MRRAAPNDKRSREADAARTHGNSGPGDSARGSERDDFSIQSEIRPGKSRL